MTPDTHNDTDEEEQDADVLAATHPETSPAAINLATLVLQLVERLAMDLRCDAMNNPYITLPGGTPRKVLPLLAREVECWFADTIYTDTARFLSHADFKQAIRVLEGRARKASRHLPALSPSWHFVERDPIALALILYANQYGTFEGKTRDLFQKLLSREIQARLRMARVTKSFPTCTQVFSRRVNAISGVLHEIGLDVHIEHRERGSYCTLWIRDAVFVREPDAVTSDASGIRLSLNSMSANGLDAADATDARSFESSTAMEEECEALKKIAAYRESNQ
jgi:hypothetical protein